MGQLKISTSFFILASQGALAHTKLFYLWQIKDSSIPLKCLRNDTKPYVTSTTQEALKHWKLEERSLPHFYRELLGTPS